MATLPRLHPRECLNGLQHLGNRVAPKTFRHDRARSLAPLTVDSSPWAPSCTDLIPGPSRLGACWRVGATRLSRRAEGEHRQRGCAPAVVHPTLNGRSGQRPLAAAPRTHRSSPQPTRWYLTEAAPSSLRAPSRGDARDHRRRGARGAGWHRIQRQAATEADLTDHSCQLVLVCGIASCGKPALRRRNCRPLRRAVRRDGGQRLRRCRSRPLAAGASSRTGRLVSAQPAARRLANGGGHWREPRPVQGVSLVATTTNRHVKTPRQGRIASRPGWCGVQECGRPAACEPAATSPIAPPSVGGQECRPPAPWSAR